MKLIRITTDNEISVHEFPDGSQAEQNETLCKLVGDNCEFLEHVMPVNLYKELGASHCAQKEKGMAVCMLVDEEGHFHGNENVNAVGSFLYGATSHGIPIVGNILIVGEYLTQDGRKICGIAESQFKLIYPQLRKLSQRAKLYQEIRRR